MAKHYIAVIENSALEFLPFEHQRKPDAVVSPHLVIRSLIEGAPEGYSFIEITGLLQASHT